MKIKKLFKWNLAITFASLYGTGFLYWWFVSRQPQGPEAEPVAWGPLFLHSHAIIGLWTLILFGYLYRSHIQPGLKVRRRRLSGITTLSACATLIVTVPGLFYLVNEEQKAFVAAVHTYLGLAFILPVLLHSFRLRADEKRPARQRNALRPAKQIH